jgi:hypothetical protein
MTEMKLYDLRVTVERICERVLRLLRRYAQASRTPA